MLQQLRVAFLLCSVFFGCLTILWTWRLGLLLRPMAIFLFTTWNVLVYFAYFVVETVAQISPVFRNAESLVILRRCMHHVALIVSVITSLVFWSIFAYDRELIHPRAFLLPDTLNHLQHSLPALLLLVDYVLVLLLLLLCNSTSKSNITTNDGGGGNRHVGRMNWKHGIVATLVIALTYEAATLVCYLVFRQWPYPFLFGISKSSLGIAALSFVLLFVCLSLLVSGIESYLLRQKKTKTGTKQDTTIVTKKAV